MKFEKGDIVDDKGKRKKKLINIDGGKNVNVIMRMKKRMVINIAIHIVALQIYF